MAIGVFGLLKDIFTEKLAELDRNYYEKSESLEKALSKNPRYQQIEGQIQTVQQQIASLDKELDKLKDQKREEFPQSWNAKQVAEQLLREDYLDLRVKATLNGTPKEEVKKLVKRFHEKDYLKAAMSG